MGTFQTPSPLTFLSLDQCEGCPGQHSASLKRLNCDQHSSTTFNSDQVSTSEACLKSTYDQNSTMDLLQEVLHVVWLENPKGGGEIVFWRNA